MHHGNSPGACTVTLYCFYKHWNKPLTTPATFIFVSRESTADSIVFWTILVNSQENKLIGSCSHWSEAIYPKPTCTLPGTQRYCIGNQTKSAGMNQYIPLPTANIAAKIKSPKTISNYSEPGATYAIVSEFHLQLECCFYGSDLHFHPSQVFYRVRTDRMATGIAAHAPYSRKCASVVSSN